MSRKRSTATRRAESQAAAERAAAIRKEQERKERRRRTLVVSGVVVVVLAVILAIGYAVQSSRDTSGTSATAPSGAVGGLAVPSGAGSAPVKVEVYEDFMCPFCGDFESASRTMLTEQVDAGNVQVRYHVLNFLDGQSTSDYSTRSANALAVVLDASGPEVAKKFHDLLFEQQPEEGSAGLSDEELLDLAVQAGADRAAVQGGVKDRSFEQWVENVTEQASKDGVNSTPTVRVDGKTVEADTIDGLVSSLREEIEEKSGS
jgi:protein-disulfide isomerase